MTRDLVGAIPIGLTKVGRDRLETHPVPPPPPPKKCVFLPLLLGKFLPSISPCVHTTHILLHTQLHIHCTNLLSVRFRCSSARGPPGPPSRWCQSGRCCRSSQTRPSCGPTGRSCTRGGRGEKKRAVHLRIPGVSVKITCVSHSG